MAADCWQGASCPQRGPARKLPAARPFPFKDDFLGRMKIVTVTSFYILESTFPTVSLLIYIKHTVGKNQTNVTSVIMYPLMQAL